MIRPDLEEVKALAAEGEYRCVPVSMEILSDVKTPMEVLRILKNISGHCYMLESVSGNEKWGRYTFLGYDPGLEITCTDGEMKIGPVKVRTSDPGSYIRQVVEDHKSPAFDYLPSFTGGLVGYFSYDYLKYAEPTLRLDAEDTEGFHDVDLMLFDKVIAFDNFRQKIILIVNISLENAEAGYNRAVMELRHMAELIRSGEPCREEPGRMTTPVKALFCKEEYCAMVERAKHHIMEGDIFQIVLSNRLEAGFEGSLLNTYRVLRTVNPSPYMFYFSSSDMEVAGASRSLLPMNVRPLQRAHFSQTHASIQSQQCRKILGLLRRFMQCALFCMAQHALFCKLRLLPTDFLAGILRNNILLYGTLQRGL